MKHITVLTFLVALGGVCTAQVSQGGYPWQWGAAVDLPDFPELSTEALDLNALAAEDVITDQFKEAPWRFGVEREVDLGLEDAGAWTFEKDRWIWRLGIHCPGATGIGLQLSQFDIPEGAALCVWNAARTHFLGSFTEANEKAWGSLALGLLDADRVVIEYQEPLAVHGQGTVRLAQIVHGYRTLLSHPDNPSQTASMGPFGNSGACNINVNCPIGADWQVAKKSVALITNGGFAVCSGALVNNTAENGTPYFLTANHCLGNPNTWVYYFNHESSSCSGSTGPTNQSVSGGTLLVNSGASDVALIQLSSTPPSSYNVEYAGWDASGSTPSSAVGIHHPSGDVKKICFENNAPYTSTTGGAQVWWINQWEDGVTEPGSSGSPLFDQNERIIGQLYGGAAACSGSNNNGAYDYYGRMDVSWGNGVSTYLDPLNTGQLTIDSYPTNSNANAGCTLPSACNYDPEAVEDDGSCLINDACGVCGGDGTSCTGCTDAAACNYNGAATIDNGSCLYPPAGEPCDCDAEGALDAVLSANEASVIYSFDAAGAPETLTFSMNWTNTGGGGNWPADLALTITAPDGSCGAVGGYNSSPAGCTSLGNYTLWPSDWQTSNEGAYSATLDLSDMALSGNGTWQVYLFNGYSTSSGAQFDASWSISGLCNADEGGGGPGGPSDCPPDLDGDGTVTVSDALILLGEFGCLSNCNADLTGDDQVTTSDMLVFLGAFGESCE
ncbi:MAG: trypsin-like peptidase domain-containing protein [Flavobacteriales bacterium]|nr:trypsin-like peptidase domain-containing protein [Flavobacteriales bacterium]